MKQKKVVIANWEFNFPFGASRKYEVHKIISILLCVRVWNMCIEKMRIINTLVHIARGNFL